MRRIRLAFAIAVLAFAPILLHGQQPGQKPAPTPTFRTSATGVQISVVVTDEKGEPVAGLRQDDFEVLEAGEPRLITTFTAVNIPMEPAGAANDERDVLTNDRPPGRLYVIALDDMSPDAALRSRHFLRDFIERHFGPNDQAAVVLTTPGPGDSGQEFTSNRRLLLSAIDRFSGGTMFGTPWAREKNFMGSFKEIMRVMSTLQVERKSLILVSSSIPGDPNLLSRAGTTRIRRMFSDVNPDFYDAMALATRNSISIYPVNPYGLTTETTVAESFDATALEERSVMSILASMTGGFALIGSNNYDVAFARLVRENSVYYSLGFNSDERKNGFASVEVRTRRPGLRVQTIEGYLGGKPPAVKRPTTVMAAAWDAVASPMTTSGVSMRMFAAPYRTNTKSAAVAVTVEIATNRLNLVERDGVYRGEVDILFAVTDSKGKKRFRVMRHRATFALKPETYRRVSERALRVQTELPLPEGRYQLRASAGVEAIAGSVVYDVEVPDFRDDFSLSGVAVTSSQARETVTVSPPGSSVVVFPGPPTTAREFAQDDVLTLFAEAYENRTKHHQMRMAMELKDSAGKVLDRLEMERTSPDKPKEPGIYRFAPSLLLEEVPPGNYVISVEAKSSLEKKPIVRTVAITVRRPATSEPARRGDAAVHLDPDQD